LWQNYIKIKKKKRKIDLKLENLKNKIDIFDVVIIGAGASGLFLANILKDSLKVAIFEKNKIVGSKLRISGGGKTNISNLYISDNNFFSFNKNIAIVSHNIKKFGIDEIFKFCKNNNLNYIKDERLINGSIFCKNNINLTDILLTNIQKSKNIKLNLSHEVLTINKIDNIFNIKFNNIFDKEVFAKKIVIASGGISYSDLIVSDISIKIAEQFNINFYKFTPALVGLTLQTEQFWFKNLSGVSILAEAKINNKILKGSMLFTHRGISGPLVMNISLYWQKGEIMLNFLPNFVIKNILDSKKQVSSLLPLPKNFILAFLETKRLSDFNLNKNNINIFEELVYELQNYNFAPAGNFGFSKAEVSRGGIDTNSLNIDTFEALNTKNLYFIGEAIDVTGELGGFNLHWAFASATSCGDSILNDFKKNI
jgi:predicted Rossmann fold flavoprotein